MRLKRIDELFEIQYGNSFNLSSLTVCEKTNKHTINFVSRTARNNGVSAVVEKIAGANIMNAGTLSVAVGGSVMETFLQPKDYYTGYHVLVLTPKIEMTDTQKLFYCVCIRKNKYKYSYGRQANKTLKNILIPDTMEIPTYINSFKIPDYEKFFTSLIHPINNVNTLTTKCNNLVPISKLFTIVSGNKLDFGKMTLKKDGVAFVSRTAQNNGVVGFVEYLKGVHTFNAGLITVSLGGTVLASFVQIQDFYTAQNVAVLIPKSKLTLSQKLYYCTCITQNRYKYSTFGREANRTLKDIFIPDLYAIPAEITKMDIPSSTIKQNNNVGVTHSHQAKDDNISHLQK